MVLWEDKIGTRLASQKKVNSNKAINKREHITIYTNTFKGSWEAAVNNDMTTKWTTWNKLTNF